MSTAANWDGRGHYSRPWLGLSTAAAGAPLPLVIACDHEEDGRTVCRSCTALLSGVLADVPALLHDLTIAEAKQVRFVEHGSLQADRSEDVVRLPWNERASSARTDLVRAVTGALRACGLSGDGSPAIRARRLTGALERLARSEAGPGYALLVSEAAGEAHAAIDRPASPWYFGPCPACHRDIYGERLEGDEDRVVCPNAECTYSAPLALHRVHQLDAGDDRLLTIAELVGAITSAGESVTRDQINNWIRREGLPRERRVRPRLVGGQMVSGAEVWVYRLGDVRRLAHEAAQRKAGAA